MTRHDDALEILLPDAGDAALGRAREVTRFLRLLSSDAEPAHASTVGVDLERARCELEASDRGDLEVALVDLLRHYASAACHSDSFAHFGDAALDPRGAWRILGEFEIEHEGLASAPLPGETPLALCERLIANLERLALDPARVLLWRARLVHAFEGAREGERAYREFMRSFPPGSLAEAEQRAAVAGIAECLLERGLVRDARALLFDHLARHGSDARARQLLCWARLALGDAAGARALLVALRPWLGPLPAGLLALREARPEWLPCLAGRAAPERASPREYAVRDRADVGAAVLAVFAFQCGTGARVVHQDVAPGLRARARQWILEVADAHEVAGAPERRTIAEARIVIDHASPASDSNSAALERAGQGTGFPAAPSERPARATERASSNSESRTVADRPLAHADAWGETHESQRLPPERIPSFAERSQGETGLRFSVAGATARARALAPIVDDENEVAGWVYVECEHHLLPSPARLAAFARGWRTAVLLARERDPEADAEALEPGADLDPDLAALPTTRIFHDLVSTLGIKLYQRRWSGFSCENGVPRLVARGGEGVGFEGERAGSGRALARAVATGGTIAFDEPDERLSLHAQAASGFVVPLTAEERAVGFFVVESSRRRDFKSKDIEACARVAVQHGLALRMAQFCAWHRARFHFEPWFDPARPDFRSFASHAIAAARSRAGVVLAGPSGVGKLVLARWLHFESDRAAGPFKVHGAGLAADASASLSELVASAAGGTLVLDDVDELAPARQEELLRYLEQVERALDRERASVAGARILATTRVGLAAARDSGRLRADLAARLDRVTLLVPPLSARREEIPALFAAMARRFADEENAAPPHLDDESMAWLWRQPWRENLRGLENVAYKLVLLYGGEVVTATHLKTMARHFGLELVRKLPSRHPDPRDLVSALRTTRTSGGRVNKTRAAFYLGWDPDTLVARMSSEGLREESLEVEAAWQVHRDEEARREDSEPERESGS